jgi:predicted HAD superfamily hydrolase
MKVLNSKKFFIHKELVDFVVKNNIEREDILAITEATATGVTLYYYALA